MRNLLLATIALFVATFALVPAAAAQQQCIPAQNDFVEDGINMLVTGKVTGAVIQGEQARAFAVEAGFAYAPIAVFLIDADAAGSAKLLMAVAGEADEKVVCFGAASAEGVALFRKHYGLGV